MIKEITCLYCGHKQQTNVKEPINYLIHFSTCENCRSENWLNTITWSCQKC